jgi:hypothetical protein
VPPSELRLVGVGQRLGDDALSPPVAAKRATPYGDFVIGDFRTPLHCSDTSCAACRSRISTASVAASICDPGRDRMPSKAPIGDVGHRQRGTE